MAEEKFQFTLELATRATGDGAKRTAEDLKRVQDTISATTDKVKVGEFGFYNLDEALKKGTVNSGKFSDSQVTVAKSSRNSSLALLELSRGFEDAQYGIRGVLNNIPSLVLSLGGTAGLAGAISIGAVAFSQIYSWMSKTEEKASDVEDRVKALADAAGQIQSDKFQQAADGIEAAAERAEALTQRWTETGKAEDAYSTAAITNAEKLAQAQALIAEALGLQVDKFRELEAIAARQAEARRVAAEQEIRAEQLRIQAAEEAATKAADALTQQKLLQLDVAADLVQQRAKLETLREQEASLKRIADQRFGIEAILPDNGGGFNLPGTATPQAQAAQAALGNAAFQTNLQATQARVDELERNLESLTKDGGIVQRAENSLLTAQRAVEDTSKAVSLRIDQIQQSLQADDILARSQTLVDQGQALAAGLQEAVGKVTANTTQAQTAKATIEQAAADGVITAQESVKIGEALRTLIGQMQAGLASYAGNVSELIQLQGQGIAQGNAMNSEIQQLKAQMSVMQGRISTLQSRK